MTTLDIVDITRPVPPRVAFAGERGRRMHVIVRYPVAGAAGEVSGAAPAGRFPLVVFAHGYDVQTATYRGLLDALVERGFVVAAPELPMASSWYAGSPDERDIANEPCDLRLVAQRMAADAAGPLTTPDGVVLAGHSDGATAATYAARNSTCSPVVVRAVVALSGRVAAPGSRPSPPLLAVTGDADTVNPPARTRALFDAAAPARRALIGVPGGSHRGPFGGPPWDERVATVTVDFLAWVLHDDGAARARLGAAAGFRVELVGS